MLPTDTIVTFQPQLRASYEGSEMTSIEPGAVGLVLNAAQYPHIKYMSLVRFVGERDEGPFVIFDRDLHVEEGF